MIIITELIVSNNRPIISSFVLAIALSAGEGFHSIAI